MANKTINQLTSIGSELDRENDLLAIWDASSATTKKISVSSIAAGSEITDGNSNLINGEAEGSLKIFNNENILGSYAFAVGLNTTASGDSSFAEGEATIASGVNSHAEGHQSTANGNDGSHAEGNQTQANGGASHAQGDMTVTLGDCAHAEGQGTTANGVASHAEGIVTIANGEGAHAEGEETIATGEYSHTEGYQTTANGAASHAEGNNTQAYGENSHSEGNHTIAYGENSHAEGRGKGLNIGSLVVTTDQTTGTTTCQYESGVPNYFKVGMILSIGDEYYEITSIDTTEQNFQLSNIKDPTLPIDISSATSLYLCTTASGQRSHAEGQGTAASGVSSHTEGYLTIASGNYSHAEGEESNASGDNAHAEGRGTTASGATSHAEGISTIASERTSHAEGYDTTASGTDSHAEGLRTTASGARSHAEGYNTTASGEGSHAEGFTTIASGDCSHAQNYGTQAVSQHQTALGRYNQADLSNQYVFIIGNGTSDTNRSNALTVDWDGRVHAHSFNYLNQGLNPASSSSNGVKMPWFNLADPATGDVYNISMNHNGTTWQLTFARKPSGGNNFNSIAFWNCTN